MTRMRRAAQRGFTLIEVIVVVAFLATLAAILIPSVTGIIARGEKVSIQADVDVVELSVNRFRLGPHRGPDATPKWGVESPGGFYPTSTGGPGDIELNRDEDDPDNLGNLRIDEFEAGPGTDGAAGDGEIDDALVWMGLLVHEAFDDTGSGQEFTDDAHAQGGEEGEFMPDFPQSAHADNTERQAGGSYTDGAFRFVVLHNGTVAAAYKSGGTWYAARGETATGGGGPSRVTSGLVVLYEFDEGSGSTVGDTSGVGTPPGPHHLQRLQRDLAGQRAALRQRHHRQVLGRRCEDRLCADRDGRDHGRGVGQA